MTTVIKITSVKIGLFHKILGNNVVHFSHHNYLDCWRVSCVRVVVWVYGQYFPSKIKMGGGLKYCVSSIPDFSIILAYPLLLGKYSTSGIPCIY